MGADIPEPASGGGSSEKPFDEEPFNAGVEADEKSDPKTYIEQLTGKLGQSLRSYTETQGQPDFELEKFAINSLLSATHTAQMSDEDQSDIIKKVENSGESEGEEQPEPEGEEPEATQEPTASVGGAEPAGTSGAEAAGAAPDAGGGAAPMNEMSLGDHNAQKLISIYDDGDEKVKKILTRLVSYSDLPNREQFLRDLRDEVDYEYMQAIFDKLEQLGIGNPVEIPAEELYEEETIFLNDPKKNNMFQPGSNDVLNSTTKCKKGFKQLGVDENNKPNCVQIHENSSRFVNKQKIKSILQESINQDDMTIQPATKPAPVVKPTEPKKPSRKDKPFKPNVTPGVKPDPKAIEEGTTKYEVYHGTLSSAVQTARAWVESRGYQISDDEWFNKINNGPRKPAEGDVNRYSLELTKNGKVDKKMLHMQVTNIGPKYELNAYIN
jgi:hypothetical protein